MLIIKQLLYQTDFYKKAVRKEFLQENTCVEVSFGTRLKQSCRP